MLFAVSGLQNDIHRRLPCCANCNQLERLQTNQYDCGLWVLMVIAAAALRGCGPDLSERDIPPSMAADFVQHL